MASIALQMWYRLPEQENVFPAISEQMGDYGTISRILPSRKTRKPTAPTTRLPLTWSFGDDFPALPYGNKKTLPCLQCREETMPGIRKTGNQNNEAYTSRLKAGRALPWNLRFPGSASRTISAQHPLTDKLVAAVKSPLPGGKALRGMISCGYERREMLLQESRTLLRSPPKRRNPGDRPLNPIP